MRPASETRELIQLIRERRIRAVEVVRDYDFEFAGLQAYVVTEPNEPERSYLVNLIGRTCTCPDYQCQVDKEGGGHGCKHLWAVLDLLGIKSTDAYQRQQDESWDYYRKTHPRIEDPDKDNPYRD